jgi:hypothetical protein
VRRHRLIPRLAFLAIVAAGLWLWKNAPGPVQRSLIWELGEDRASVSSIEIQIWDSAGKLVKREEFHFEASPPAELPESVPLGQGEYKIRTFVCRRGEPMAIATQSFWVTASDTYRLPLR